MDDLKLELESKMEKKAEYFRQLQRIFNLIELLGTADGPKKFLAEYENIGDIHNGFLDLLVDINDIEQQLCLMTCIVMY